MIEIRSEEAESRSSTIIDVSVVFHLHEIQHACDYLFSLFSGMSNFFLFSFLSFFLFPPSLLGAEHVHAYASGIFVVDRSGRFVNCSFDTLDARRSLKNVNVDRVVNEEEKKARGEEKRNQQEH